MRLTNLNKNITQRIMIIGEVVNYYYYYYNKEFIIINKEKAEHGF